MGTVGFGGDRSYWVDSCTRGSADGVPVFACIRGNGREGYSIQYSQ